MKRESRIMRERPRKGPASPHETASSVVPEGRSTVVQQNWQPRVGHACGDRPWETPDREDTSELPQLAVDGLPGFNAAVGSFKAKTGMGVDAIHPSKWSRISEKGTQLYTDLSNAH